MYTQMLSKILLYTSGLKNSSMWLTKETTSTNIYADVCFLHNELLNVWLQKCLRDVYNSNNSFQHILQAYVQIQPIYILHK
jgi:hypothetical protein